MVAGGMEVFIAALVAAFGSGGAAWAGVRVSLNGTRERVKRMEDTLDRMGERMDLSFTAASRSRDAIRDSVHDVRLRVAVLEAVRVTVVAGSKAKRREEGE